MTGAALIDENELAALHNEQSQIITFFKDQIRDTWRIKLNRLAEIIERRRDLADPQLQDEDLATSQISTYITHLLRANNIPIADHVSDYLEAKYKNSNLSRDGPQRWGGIDIKLLMEEFISAPPEEFLKQAVALKTIFHEKMNDVEKAIETDAREEHYQLNGMQLRDPIQTPRPLPPRVTEYSKAVHKHWETLGDWEQFVIKYPPPPEREEEYAQGEMASFQHLVDFMNIKNSLVTGEWLERDLYRIHQSKHGAAVKDKVETFLCAKCTNLKNQEYDPNDFVEMEWDWNANGKPEHWRCPRCQGTVGIKRGLTREQCGDKALQSCPNCKHHFNWDQALSPIEVQAIYYYNNLPGYYNSLTYFKEIARKAIAVRKVELGVDLSLKA